MSTPSHISLHWGGLSGFPLSSRQVGQLGHFLGQLGTGQVENTPKVNWQSWYPKLYTLQIRLVIGIRLWYIVELSEPYPCLPKKGHIFQYPHMFIGNNGLNWAWDRERPHFYHGSANSSRANKAKRQRSMWSLGYTTLYIPQVKLTLNLFFKDHILLL